MIYPYCFTDRVSQVGFNIILDSHHINHANSNITIKPIYEDLGVHFQYINKILQELATIYTRRINQYKFKCQTVFSSRFDKQNEFGQMSDEIDLHI